ncbi:hypothetical protein ACLOJK_008216 [Asimina triloba]
MEHHRCSIIYMGRQPWLPPLPPPVKPHTPTPTATVRSRRRHHAAAVATTLPSPTNEAVAVERANTHGRRTHYVQASRWTIQAIHHDGDDEHIPDPSRPQADVDHRGHTRRVFLARHRQIQLYPAPIVAHFRSKPSHHSIHIFMDHSTDFDPRMDQRQRSTRRFLLEPIRPSIFSKAAASISRHQQGLDQWIQAVHHAGHRPHHLPASGPSTAGTLISFHLHRRSATSLQQTTLHHAQSTTIHGHDRPISSAILTSTKPANEIPCPNPASPPPIFVRNPA